MDRSVGIIGLGIMGGAIARNLVERGWRVTGTDTDPSRQEALSTAGVTVVESAGAVAAATSHLLTSLPSAGAAMTVAGEIAQAGLSPRRIAEVSTLSIADKLAFRDRLAAAGHDAMDCPLSGTGAQAITRDLVVYASGTSEAVAARVSSPQGRALAHAVLSAHGSPELAAAASDPALRAQQGALDLVRRAAERGEWDPEVHAPDAIFAMVTGGVMHRLWFERLPLTPAWIDVAVDVLAVGLAPRPRRA